MYGGPGNDDMRGERGADQIFGGAGNDWLFSNQGQGPITSPNQPSRERDTAGAFMSGGAGDDRMVGSTAWDRMLGGPGNDTMWGFEGQDWMRGGPGNDTIAGGANHRRHPWQQRRRRLVD